ncbi:TlpA family protein disulfide reductase [Qipengyuania aurantiaca]|uniref:TlpA family protein disulfide reductase n=1 Tax=Qipengyuania aurantiaca TaxID=2867233 RepID=A0ABX8ZJ81_9SPHN|nr:TlpA disulfide reductase family protein [Qipengyuania aurantiaca]QZD89012.1 TlpA family protein disulfide reductase [Qipengyuania aurantiaca]
MSRFSLTLVSIFALSLAACDRSAPDAAQESGASSAASGEIDRGNAGALMPAANLRDLEERELNLGAVQGTPVLLNLWATWCAPCIKEMPLLDELAGDYGESLRVLTVSQDMGGPDKVADFFAQNRFDHLESWMDPQAELGFALGGGSLPTTVMYDAQGQEVWRVRGDYDWSSEEARAAIDAVLAN